MNEQSSMAAPDGIPAATLIVFRDCPRGGPAQVLMTVRSRSLAFAGGMAVFPGGRVDQEDFALAARYIDVSGSALELEEAAHQIAAIRETLEETGLALGVKGNLDAIRAIQARAMLVKEGSLSPVLNAFDWELDLDQVVPFARWFPKNENLSRVYDTRFYLANLGTGAVEISPDKSETTHLFWTSARGALDMADAGDIKLIFPTRRNLERLALFATFDEARSQAEAIPVKTIIPRIDDNDGDPMLTIMEDAGYPITAELLDNVSRS